MSYAYICNNTDGTLSKVDLSTFTVVATLSGLTDAFCVVVDSSETFAYVSTGFPSGGDFLGGGTIYQIDLSTFTVVNTLTPVGFFSGQYMAIDPTDTYLYCGGTPFFRVWQIDLSTFSVVGSGLIVATNIRGIAIDPLGNYAYVSSDSGGDSVYKIDLSTFTVVGSPLSLIGGATAGGITVDSAGDYAYCLATQIELSSFTITGHDAPTAFAPNGVSVDPGNTVLVVAAGAGIQFYDPLVPFTNSGAISVSGNTYQVSIDSAGVYVYATNYTAGTLSKIDLSTLSVVSTLAVGNGPYGIAARPQSPPLTEQICMVI